MFPRVCVPIAALALTAATARADDATSDPRDDHRGFVGSAELALGMFEGVGASLGASAGWGITPSVAVLARGVVAASIGSNDSLLALQPAIRFWPSRVDLAQLSIEAHGGWARVTEPGDCFPIFPGPDAQCTGGTGDESYSYGGTLRVQGGRGRHGSFDMTITYDRLRWRDGSDDSLDHASLVTIGLGFSVY